MKLLVPASMAASSKQLLIVVVAVLVAPALAADLLVGDAQGWNPGVDFSKWADGNEFIVGDTLVFKYVPGQHSVVEATSAEGFAACSQANSIRTWTSGDDRVPLNASGQAWFFSGVGDDCTHRGMKLNISVLPAVKLSDSTAAPTALGGGGFAAALAAGVAAAAALLF